MIDFHARPGARPTRPSLTAFASLCRLALVVAAVATAAGGCRSESPTHPPTPSDRTVSAAVGAGYVPGRVLVRFRPGADAASIAASHGARTGRSIGLGIRVLGVPTGREPGIAAALARDAGVEFAEPDWLRTLDDPACTGCALPDDDLFGYKWDLHNGGEITSSSGDVLAATGEIDADMDWREAFDRLGPGFAGTARVAILDTGVRITHEDLAAKIVGQHDFYDDDPDATDDQGHGTHVAGIAAALGDNGVGLAGVAYGGGIGILAARVCTPTLFGLSAECPSSAVAEAIQWAADQGADAINVSLGGAEPSESERQAFQYARDRGALAFCAAGNNAENAVLYPAAFDECVAVSATDWADGLASYSNWGPEVDLSAPGGDSEDPNGYSQIASTCFGGDGEYCLKAGTSMATPQAAGLAALLRAAGLSTPDQVLVRMRESADDLGEAGWDERFGHGRINAFRAMEGLTGGDGGEPPNEAPIADFTFVCDDLACSFTDASSDPDGTVVDWSWDFGDGSGSVAQNPTHAYACAGEYAVNLTVTDDGGATARSTVTVSAAASGGAPGDPSAVPGLLIWLRADALTRLADGDPVARWDDRSGRCHHATQTVAGKRPVFRTDRIQGRPAVVFDAVDDGMTTPLDPGIETTIVAVYASRAGTTGYLLNGGFNFFMGPYVGRYRNFTGGYATGPPVEAGRWIVHTLRQGATEDELFVDGVWTSSTSKRADPAAILLGRQGTYSQVLDGAVAELVVYDRALTDAELETVHDWMIERYVPPPDVNGPPVASFTESCTDLACAFTDASSDPDGTIVAWSWTFGDGASSSVTDPTHVYTTVGTYAVTLEVTDDEGATDAATKEITIVEPSPDGPFVDPSSVPDLVLWLRADAIEGVGDGDPVATWPDASGRGHDAVQATGSKRPVYRADRVNGLPALEFDASDDGMKTGADPGIETTVFVVYASRAGNTGYVLHGGFRFFMGPYVGRYRNYTGGYASGPKIEAGRWRVQTLRQDAIADELFVDGVYAAKTKKRADPTAIRLARQGTYGQALDGDLAEVVVYDRALTDAERGEVEAWLLDRYGIPVTP